VDRIDRSDDVVLRTHSHQNGEELGRPDGTAHARGNIEGVGPVGRVADVHEDQYQYQYLEGKHSDGNEERVRPVRCAEHDGVNVVREALIFRRPGSPIVRAGALALSARIQSVASPSAEESQYSP